MQIWKNVFARFIILINCRIKGTKNSSLIINFKPDFFSLVIILPLHFPQRHNDGAWFTCKPGVFGEIIRQPLLLREKKFCFQFSLKLCIFPRYFTFFQYSSRVTCMWFWNHLPCMVSVRFSYHLACVVTSSSLFNIIARFDWIWLMGVSIFKYCVRWHDKGR